MQPHLSDDWEFTIDVTEANGGCAGDELEGPDATTITITQTGCDLKATGWVDDPGNSLWGYARGNTVTLSGRLDEDGGTTLATHTLELNSPTELEGTENWEWFPPGQTGKECPDGASDVTATRLP